MPNVPQAGTKSIQQMCPTGVLGYFALRGHSEEVLTNRISFYRKSRKLTQEQLAEAIGTTRNQLVKLEKGSRPLSSDWLEKIGDELKVAPYLLIAPESILPTEDELAQILASAQSSLRTDLPYSEWPRAVAAGLHMRLRMIAGDRANADAAHD